MADVKKKNTVTVEKQDGTKKEVQTKNVSTPKKESVGSKIKDRLTSAYSKVVSPYKTTEQGVPDYNDNPTPVKYGSFDSGNGRTDTFVDVNTDSFSARPYWKQTENGQNRYVADVSKPINGWNYDTKGTDPEYYAKRETPIGTFEAGSMVADDGAPRDYWGAYTSPISRNSGTLDDGRTYDVIGYDNPMTKGGHYDSYGDAYAQRFGNTYAAGVETPYNMEWLGEHEARTPLGTFGLDGGYDSPYGIDAYYKSPVNYYDDGYERGYEYSPNGVDRFGASQNNWGERNLYYDRNGNRANLYANEDGLGAYADIPYEGDFSRSVDLPFGGRASVNAHDGNFEANYYPREGSVPSRLLRAMTRR